MHIDIIPRKRELYTMLKSINNRIVFLDYMRIFAFVSVVIGHRYYSQEIQALSTDLTVHITIRTFLDLITPLVYGGAAGVIIFFLTSGYIITHVLQTENTLDFYIKRIFRIYPLYVFALCVELLMNWGIKDIPVPPFASLVPRFLLIGDFFNSEYGLAGVEWTLRVEILFYVFMGSLKYLGLINKPSTLPYLFGAVGLLLYVLPAFPTKEIWSHGYFSIYFYFLLIGSCAYLAQAGLVSTRVCTTFSVLLFILHIIKITEEQSSFLQSNYAIISMLIFFISLRFQSAFVDSPLVRTLSDLTFSVYLLHQWVWSYLLILITPLGISERAASLIIIPTILLISYCSHKWVEIPGIKLGKSVTKLIKGQQTSPPAPAVKI